MGINDTRTGISLFVDAQTGYPTTLMSSNSDLWGYANPHIMVLITSLGITFPIRALLFLCITENGV